jgi:hypothetical protein
VIDWPMQALSFAGAFSTLVAMAWARTSHKGWILALASEVLWVWWSVATQAWGVLWLSVSLAGVYAWNIWKWRQDVRQDCNA